jgi:Flp pilus assembly protein TadD
MIYVETGGNLDVALKLAQVARAQLPGVPEVSDTLGLVYFRKGLALLAIGAFQDSVAKDPRNPGYHAHLGLAYAKSGEPDKARESLKKAFALGQTFPDVDEAKAALATLTSSRGD